ncbi:MAG: hypothetical protein F7C32_02235 [Desulfurococcales archaeon]|nr:hypothetical protein [Desulfurococcales archaeon]
MVWDFLERLGVVPGGYVTFNLALDLKDERIPVLTVKSSASSVNVEYAREKVIRVSGKRRRRGMARISLLEENKKLIALVECDSASLTVKGPFRGFTTVADTSGVALNSSQVLEYVGVKADTSGVKIDTPLNKDGYIYLKLDTSSAKLTIKPVEVGEYKIEVNADTSSIKLDIESGFPVYYILDTKKLDASSFNVKNIEELAGTSLDDAVILRLKLKLDTSSFKLSKKAS